MLLLYCIFIFLSFDCIHFFPLNNCNAQSKYFQAFIDCRDEVEYQDNFMSEVEKYFTTRSHTDFSSTSFIMMIGRECLQETEFDGFPEIVYNDTLPFGDVMKNSNEFKDNKSKGDCESLILSFVFIHNVTNINSSNNDILNTIVYEQNQDRKTNIFFIIQSSENPNTVYRSMDFIYFTSSFKDLDVDDIFPKICDRGYRDDSLSYTGGSHVTSSYRIAARFSGITHEDARCYCNGRHGMDLVSFESYDEVVELARYISLSAFNSTTVINIPLGLKHSGKLVWDSKNPFHFFRPFQRLEIGNCFYMTLSFEAKGSLFNIYNKSAIGRYIVAMDCNKRIENSLVFCERQEVLPEQQRLPFNEHYQTSEGVQAIETITFMYITRLFYFRFGCRKKDPFNPLFFHCLVKECILNGEYTNTTLDSYLCNSDSENRFDSVYNKSIHLISKNTTHFFKLQNVDISKCKNYNGCQNKVKEEMTIEQSSNTDVDIYCSTDRESQDNDVQCTKTYKINLNFSLEQFPCATNKSNHFYKCIKGDTMGDCEDNSHLQECEKFVCPKPFIKCPNSYCIVPSMKYDTHAECPYGEDEHKSYKILCDANFELVLRDFCVESDSFHNFIGSFVGENFNFVCDNVCPRNYKCVSSKIVDKYSNTTDIRMKLQSFNIGVKLKLLPSMVFPEVNLFRNFPAILIVSFRGSFCGLKNFDHEFQYWKFQHILMLDLSHNKFVHGNALRSINKFTKLKHLNLSHNEHLIIDDNFEFPYALEVIDLAHTQIYALKENVFEKLIYLKHVNLSYTFIARFQEMGIPEYFTLNTLYIQGVSIEYIDLDLFRGLTINYELMATDYVMCCPQILNTNISVDKCHAPIDIISSCKHLVGDTFKRIVIWIVGLLTIVGNGIVLVFRISWNREIFKKAYGLFITGLAISDLIMGVYLMIIAGVDAYYKEVYILDDFKWRKGFLCNLCGFLSTLSSETSTFFICMITLDRFLCITYPFGEHRFSKSSKILSFSLVWFVGIVLAIIPVVLSDWEIYSSNGLCLALPLSPTQNKGWIFSFVVFVGLNFVLFLLIALGQLTIFINLIKVKKSIPSIRHNSPRRSEDLSVAKKLAFVAFTDFCCWFPVGILGFLSLNGYIFNREVYAWIAVFVLPINSALNPIIYTVPAVYGKCKQTSYVQSITLSTHT